MKIIRKENENRTMRYEVVLIGYDLEGYLTQYPPILETNDKHEAFEFMGAVKEKENKEPYCNYEEVRVLDRDEWVARMRLY
jgi:hypothetical protein